MNKETDQATIIEMMYNIVDEKTKTLIPVWSQSRQWIGIRSGAGDATFPILAMYLNNP